MLTQGVIRWLCMQALKYDLCVAFVGYEEIVTTDLAMTFQNIQLK